MKIIKNNIQREDVIAAGARTIIFLHENVLFLWKFMKIIKKQYKKITYDCRRRPNNYFFTQKCVIFMKIQENHQKSIYIYI